MEIAEDITPLHLRCGSGGCPSVLKLQNGDLIIIGKKVDAALNAEISHRVADDEYAVVIGASYFANLVPSSE